MEAPHTMTGTPIFVSDTENPLSFHQESCWVPHQLSTLVDASKGAHALERLVFSVLVNEALVALESHGDVVALAPFPLFQESSPPPNVLKLNVYLDEFSYQRLHYAKQVMYPNRRVGTDEFLWSLCHHHLAAAGLALEEQLPAAMPRKVERRSPVSEDFRFANLYGDVYGIPLAESSGGVAAPAAADSAVQATAAPHSSPSVPADSDQGLKDPADRESGMSSLRAPRVRLIDAASIRRFLTEVNNEDARFAYLNQIGGRDEIPLAMAPSEDTLDELARECPNFIEVLEFLQRQASLCRSGGVPFSMPPLLLLGPPGVGKTHFARQLGKRLKVDFKFVPMNSMSAGFALTGMHRTWQKATPGLVARTLLESQYANPLFMLDEIDKCTSNGSQASPVDALYQLLEPETSSSFTDEFFDLPMDASRLLWVATANDSKSLPAPLLSRFKVFTLDALTAEETLFVASRVLTGIVGQFGVAFSTTLDDECAKGLASLSARDMRIILTDAMGNALRQGRSHLSRADLQVAGATGASKKASMGFLG